MGTWLLLSDLRSLCSRLLSSDLLGQPNIILGQPKKLSLLQSQTHHEGSCLSALQKHVSDFWIRIIVGVRLVQVWKSLDGHYLLSRS